MGPQEISENGSPSTFWTTSRDGLFGVKSKEEDPLRLKTSVIFPSTLFICSRATNPGVFPGLENVFQIRLQICWEPQISWPLLTLLHHCTSSISPPISSDHSVLWVFFFFFPNFHFSLVFRKADRVPEKVLAHWKKGHRHYVFRSSKNITARRNQIWEAGYPNLLIYLLRCWWGGSSLRTPRLLSQGI